MFDITPRNCSYEEFLEELSVLDIMDKTGTFTVRQDLYSFLQKVVKKPTDNRIELYEVYTRNLYKMLVEDAENSLKVWYTSYIDLKKPIKEYLQLPTSSCLEGKIFNGQKYGKTNLSGEFIPRPLYEKEPQEELKFIEDS